MEPTERRVRDLMVLLDEYAVVDSTASLLDALRALQTVQTHIRDGSHRHRAVLVRDQNRRIVGKIGHLGFLRAVRTATGDSIAGDPRMEVAGVDEDMILQSKGVFRLLADDLQSLCSNASSARVRDAMRPVTEHIDESATLLEALDAFDRWETLSLLVTRNSVPVGVLRLVDLFDEIADRLMTCHQDAGKEETADG